jgi:HSP20 family protein
MNALTRGDQLRQLEALQPGLGSQFRPFLTPCPKDQKEPLAASEWTPLLDISEDAHEYLIHAQLPAVNREDVKVTAEDGTLTIMGGRKFVKVEKGKNHQGIERADESFQRRYSLPDNANSAQVSSEFKDGLLTVHLVKRDENIPRPEGVVDEITAWWQNALGKMSVLGQASNKPEIAYA